jgi:hypothetical protein
MNYNIILMVGLRTYYDDASTSQYIARIKWEWHEFKMTFLWLERPAMWRPPKEQLGQNKNQKWTRNDGKAKGQGGKDRAERKQRHERQSLRVSVKTCRLERIYTILCKCVKCVKETLAHARIHTVWTLFKQQLYLICWLVAKGIL